MLVSGTTRPRSAKSDSDSAAARTTSSTFAAASGESEAVKPRISSRDSRAESAPPDYAAPFTPLRVPEGARSATAKPVCWNDCLDGAYRHGTLPSMARSQFFPSKVDSSSVSRSTPSRHRMFTSTLFGSDRGT